MGWGNAAGTREGDGYIPKHKLIMALFSTWYSGDGPMPQDGQGPGQLGRGGVPLPFHFAFPVFPSLFLPTAILRYEAHEGTVAGLFSPLPHHAASSSLALAEGSWVPGATPTPAWPTGVMFVL